MRSVIAGFVVSIALVTTASAQTVPAPSVWINQRTSELDIASVDAAGVITGKFTNNAAGFKCQGTPIDIVGHTSKDGLFFGVTFAACNSIVLWNGRISGNTMTTSWVLSVLDPENVVIESESDVDTFTKQ